MSKNNKNNTITTEDSKQFLKNIKKEIKEQFTQIKETQETPFFGRKREFHLFDTLFKASRSTGVGIGVYGLRRSGKTRTIKQYIKEKMIELENQSINSIFFSFAGDFQKSKKRNILNATSHIEEVLEKYNILTENYEDYCTRLSPKISWFSPFEWRTFFNYFESVLNKIPNKTKIFIFFDEAAWYSKNDDFITSFSHWWNVNAFDRIGMMLFLASSNKSWMNSNIVKDKKRMFKRLSNVEIKPFSFKEMVEVFRENEWVASKEDILTYYLIFGGFIKHYLDNDFIKFYLPLSSNEKIFQNRDFINYLDEEYLAIFDGVLSNRLKYKEIIEFIYNKKQCTLKQLSDFFEKNHSIKPETLKKQIQRLEEEGLIDFFRFEDSKKQYYISINFLSFYLKWKSDDFQYNSIDFKVEDGSFYNWRGWMFEIFVFKNLEDYLKTKEIFKYSACLNKEIKNKDLNLSGKPNTTVSQIDILVKTKTTDKNKNNINKYLILECKFFDTTKNYLIKEIKEEVLLKEKLLERALLVKKQEEDLKINFEISSEVITTAKNNFFLNVFDYLD